MDKIEELEKRIESIEKRNVKVEESKAWETSVVRKIILAILTYILIGLLMTFIGISNPWANAIIPAIGFMLSTLTLSFIKSLWLNQRNKS